MSWRRDVNGEYFLIRPNPVKEAEFNATMIKVAPNKWRPRNSGQSIGEFPRYSGPAYIIGKGPSLDRLRAKDFIHASAPIICINQSVHRIEELQLPNPIYVIQQDVQLQELCRPKSAKLILSVNAQNYYCDIPDKYIFDPREFGLINNELTAICAVELLKKVGIEEIIFYGFDSVLGNVEYAKSLGHTPGSNPQRFLGHKLRIVAACGSLRHSFQSPSTNFHFLSIATIIKNEARYIDEWIAFYLTQGVDHFYIYLNDCTDDVTFKLKPYKDVVTLITMNGPGKQFEAYQHAFKNSSTEWLGCLDLDEFCFGVKKTIKELLENEYKDFSGLAAHWYFYGSNNLITTTPGTVCSRFTKRGLVDRHVKSFVHLSKIGVPIEIKDVHKFYGFSSVDENKKILNGPLDESGTAEIIRINHYGCKSLEEYKNKCSKGRADRIDEQRTLDQFTMYDQNIVEDPLLFDYKPEVTLITATGDRPEALSLCEQMMKRQSFDGRIQWIVVDDGVTPASLTMGQEYARRERKPEDPAHTLIPNLRASIPYIRGEYIFFIEDDDYYSPNYITTYLQHLQKWPLVGAQRSRYYTPKVQMWKIFGNTQHASLCQTALHRSLLPTMIKECENNDPLLDLRLFRKISKRFLFYSEKPLAVGIKGLPGRKGQLLGHERYDGFIKDNNWERLKEWIGDDYQQYVRFAS